ncbi:hypothetical protein [Streptomyces sp. NBC_00483]|uniref:hypothetical protein n=1 Tax=Streptomyces sp. NBC_00483 TaxID=2975756 RepID=UPI002E19E00B
MDRGMDHDFLAALTGPLADRTARLASPEGPPHTTRHRALASDAKALVAAWVWERPEASGHVTVALQRALNLRELQGKDGLFGGDNLASPPDSSFTMNDVCLLTQLIDTVARERQPSELADLRAVLTDIREAATPALLVGGVHTPNHRWELCAALARLHRLAPDPRIPERIDDWLAEGIDLQPDGMYSERSPLYAAHVTNPSLLAIADVLDRDELREPVRRNLAAFAALYDADGCLESVHSRRQDQRARFFGDRFLMPYRALALRADEPERALFARMARTVQEHGVDGETAADALTAVLIDPALAEPLPSPSRPAERTESVFATSGLAQLHDGARTLTVYGGGDIATTPRIGSGIATNPTFLRLRQGAAVLESVRLYVDFFSLGPFRAEGLERLGPGKYRLASDRSASFYQPLPPSARRADGAYPLGDEGRFHAAMDFAARPADTHHLTVTAEVTATATGVRVDFDLDSTPTTYALELAFRPGGTLTGTTVTAGPDRCVIGGPEATYTVGSDILRVTHTAPACDREPSTDPGEQFGYLGASDTAPGVKAYITGTTPARFTLTVDGTV